MTVQVKNADLDPVPGAVVQFCCNADGRFWDARVTDKNGESSSIVQREWIEAGLEIRATAPDHLSRYSSVPTSILDKSGERLFLITLPDKQVTHVGRATGRTASAASDCAGSHGRNSSSCHPDPTAVSCGTSSNRCARWAPTTTRAATTILPRSGYDPRVPPRAARNSIGRYLSEYDGHGGTFRITLNSSTTWSGSYRDDGEGARRVERLLRKSLRRRRCHPNRTSLRRNEVNMVGGARGASRSGL